MKLERKLFQMRRHEIEINGVPPEMLRIRNLVLEKSEHGSWKPLPGPGNEA